MRRDLVVDGVGPYQLADELPAGAGGRHAEYLQAFAHLVPDVGKALVHDFDRTAVGLDVDLLDHLAVLVEDHEVGGHRADVHAQVRAYLALGRELVRLYPVTEKSDVLHREGLSGREIGGESLTQAASTSRVTISTPAASSAAVRALPMAPIQA